MGVVTGEDALKNNSWKIVLRIPFISSIFYQRNYFV